MITYSYAAMNEDTTNNSASRLSLVLTKISVAPDGLVSEGSDALTLSGEIDITPILSLDDETNLPVTEVRPPPPPDPSYHSLYPL